MTYHDVLNERLSRQDSQSGMPRAFWNGGQGGTVRIVGPPRAYWFSATNSRKPVWPDGLIEKAWVRCQLFGRKK